jgi:hypothetical protein
MTGQAQHKRIMAPLDAWNCRRRIEARRAEWPIYRLYRWIDRSFSREINTAISAAGLEGLRGEIMTYFAALEAGIDRFDLWARAQAAGDAIEAHCYGAAETMMVRNRMLDLYQRAHAFLMESPFYRMAETGDF